MHQLLGYTERQSVRTPLRGRPRPGDTHNAVSSH
jgi:hypothetical protein